MWGTIRGMKGKRRGKGREKDRNEEEKLRKILRKMINFLFFNSWKGKNIGYFECTLVVVSFLDRRFKQTASSPSTPFKIEKRA